MTGEKKEKVTWDIIQNIFNDRSLSEYEIIRKIRNVFEIEFFQAMIEINETELEDRKESIKKYVPDP